MRIRRKNTAPSKSSEDASDETGEWIELDVQANKVVELLSKSSPKVIYADVYNGNSPYAEVRASVPNIDDVDMLQNTLRMWVIGISLLVASSGANMNFMANSRPFTLSPFLIIVVAWPIGKLWEALVPNVWILNPGPFTYKEHALIALLAFTSTTALISDATLSMAYYAQHLPKKKDCILPTLITIWGAQFMGMAVAGPLKRVLVDPASMVWPSRLVSVTLVSTLHMKWNYVANGWRVTRRKFFTLATIGCALYSIIPNYAATFLGNFCFACWITPKNYVVNQLFGTQSGAGLFPVTFDWNTAASPVSSPLVPPARVFASIGLSFLVFYVFISSGIHYSNIWWGHYVPFNSSGIFDRYGKIYDVRRILDPQWKFSLEGYKNYSAVFLPTTRIMNIAMCISASIAVIVHFLFFDLRRMWSYVRRPNDDVHTRLMKRYNPVPMYWYGILFLAGMGFTVGAVECYHTNTKMWHAVLGFVFLLIWVVPVVSVIAATTVVIHYAVFTEVVLGFIAPGNACAVEFFKTWTFTSIAVAGMCIGNMKFAHYVKLRPKLVFFVQMVGILVYTTVQVVILLESPRSVLHKCSGIDDPNCSQEQTFYGSAVLWGVLGSKVMFKQYHALFHSFWIGALMPALSWLWLKQWPRSPLRVIHWAVLFNALRNLPPATPYSYSCWLVVGVIFGYWIKRYWYSWWAKYNYILSAALSCGLSIAQVILFFVFLAEDPDLPSWWGNVGFKNTIDGKELPMCILKDGQSFGPSTW